MEIREAMDSAGLTGIHLRAAPKATWPPQSPSLTPHQGRKGSPLATGLPVAWPSSNASTHISRLSWAWKSPSFSCFKGVSH